MKFSIKDFFSKRDQIRSFLRIWSHLLKKSLMKNSNFCAVKNHIIDVWQVLTTQMFHKYFKNLLCQKDCI